MLWNALSLFISISSVEFIMNIGATTGVVLDPTYTGKAVRGLVSELNNNPSRFKGNKILFIHTGKWFLKSNIKNCKHVVSWKMDIIMYTIFSLSILWYNVLLLHVYKMVKHYLPLSTSDKRPSTSIHSFQQYTQLKYFFNIHPLPHS